MKLIAGDASAMKLNETRFGRPNSQVRKRIKKLSVGVNSGPTHEHTRMCGEQRRTLQHRGTNRSDQYGGPVRPVSLGQPDEDSTNARLGGTLSGQVHLGLP